MQAVAVGVLADGDEDLAHRPLDARQVDRRVDGWSLARPRVRCRWASVRRTPTRCPPPALGRGGLDDRLAASGSATGCASATGGRPTSSGSTGTGISVGSGSGTVDARCPCRAVRRSRRARRPRGSPCSTSASASRSSVARCRVRISRASSWASSSRRRTSSSIAAATSSRVVGLVAHLLAEERLALAVAELLRAERVAHAVLRDHRPGDLRGPLDVVRGAGRGVAEDRAPRRCARPAASPSRRASSRAGARCTCPRSGSASVQPSARPRATIDTLWIGSVFGQHVADERVAALVVGDRRASRART